MYSDIEDFTTDQLRAEIAKREALAREQLCWYCKQNLVSHTCKYAKPSPVPGWELSVAIFNEEGGGCMASEAAHYRVLAKHPVLNLHATGIGDTAQEATANCIKNIKARTSR